MKFMTLILVEKLHFLPEDPENSTPGRFVFFIFFWASQKTLPVRDTKCNMVILFENVGVHFYEIKTGLYTPIICFLEEKMGKSFKKSNSGVSVQVLIV